MNNKNDFNNLYLGLQFTSSIITPVIIFLVGGSYIQRKYYFPSYFMGICAFLTVFFIVLNLVSFVKKAIKFSYSNSKSKGDDNAAKK